jgi:hypothetical protein
MMLKLEIESTTMKERLEWPSASIQTFTGIRFYPLEPDPATIDVRDIAHALSLKCRYTGHSAFFYSVATHCVLLADYVAHLGLPIDLRRWALLHDAAEAYLPDVASPIKDHLPRFREFEDVLTAAVAKRFELQLPIPDEILRLDRLMYWREREVLLKDAAWVNENRRPGWEVPTEMRVQVPVPHWLPPRSEVAWINRFRALFDERLHGELPW